jgi:hypothetical protein
MLFPAADPAGSEINSFRFVIVTNSCWQKQPVLVKYAVLLRNFPQSKAFLLF